MTAGHAPDPTSFEIEFASLIAKAREGAQNSLELVERFVHVGADQMSMPQVAIWRLHLTASSMFRGALKCLENNDSSLGALPLIRGLIEAWSHLFYITDMEGSGTPALRAIQFEHGTLAGWAAAQKKMTPDFDYNSEMKGIEKRMRELYVAHGHDGVMRQRTYKDVEQSLKKCSSLPDFSELQFLYAVGSVASHATAVDFLITLNPEGAELTWVSPARRAAWFRFAVKYFDYSTLLALSLSADHEVKFVPEQLRQYWLSICNDQVIEAALSAELNL